MPRALRCFKGTLIGDDGGRLLAGTVDRKDIAASGVE
jgi:hypothetical protein